MSDEVLIALITGSLTLIGVIITAYPSGDVAENSIREVLNYDNSA